MKRLLGNVLFVFVGAALGLASAEVMLRLAGVGYESLLRPDVDRGWALQPGAIGWDSAAEEYVRINDDGLRDPDHEREKPAGTWRLAVLGDSFTQGREAKLEDIFPRRLEVLLRSCAALAGREPEVLNFGVRGYGTAQELLTLPQAWEYDPDAVLLAFYVGNDVAENHPRLAPTDAYLRPYFRRGEDGGLIADFGFRESKRFRFEMSRIGRLKTRLKSHLRTWQFASRLHLLLRARWNASRTDVRRGPSREYWNVGIAPGALAHPTDTEWEEAWSITEELLISMRDEVQSRGRAFFMFTVSAPVQVLPDPVGRRAASATLGVADVLYPERRLTEFAGRNDIRFFPLIDEMQRRAEREQSHLHGSETTGKGYGHWNPQGHAIASELLAERICATLERSAR